MTDKRFVTHEAVERARQVDLLSYLQATSPFELVRCGANEFCTREHDSLKISNGKWYWWSQGIGGVSALDYLIKVKSLDFVSAVETVTNERTIVPSGEYRAKSETKSLFLPSYTFDCKRVKEYLIRRGIDGEIVDDFINRNLIAESIETGSAMFFGTDDNGKVRQCSERATDNSGLKKDSYGSDRSYFFFSKAERECTSVGVFESAIDLLSFATILKMRGIDYKRFHLISLSGIYLPAKDGEHFRLPKSLKRFLEEHAKTKKILLHLDSDNAGRRGADGIISVLQCKYEVRYLPPKFGKDYNDYLMHIRNLENLKYEKEEQNERNEKICCERNDAVLDCSRD